METKPIGLYVHIPFCKRKCNYCDFCSVPAEDDAVAKYIDSLNEEIKSYKRLEKIKVDSIFIGGGTPSYISASNILKITDTIRNSFLVTDDVEFTIEINPGTLDVEKAIAFEKAGVNRVSIGMQSIHENELKKLGRIHNYNEFVSAFEIVKKYITDNINVDIMYAIPNQTKESFERTLESVIELQPTHISCYGLIIEEGTPFFDWKDSLMLPGEEDEVLMYTLADSLLCNAGYEHYEISNYAKPGYRCVHNLKYWKDEEYIGVGISAHSYYEGKRYSNTCDFNEYYNSCGEKYRKVQAHIKGKDPFEYAMLALRLSDGFSLSEYEALFGKSFLDGKEMLINKYEANGLMKIDGDRIKITSKGFYLSNALLTELLDFPLDKD